MKVLVLYVFHIYNERVQHFIDNCIFKDSSVDFIIISNNLEANINVPDFVMTLKRENIGYDFGGWSEALLKNNLYLDYTHFIFANSSITGPFLKPEFDGKWTDIYINGLQNNVKLFGTTINCIEEPLTKSHVQSFIFSMDIETLQYLIDCEIFSINNYSISFLNAINDKEILMSRKIIENGWNIGSLLKYYNGVDFRFIDKKPLDYHLTFLNDVMYPKYKNRLWKLTDLVFIKGNRIPV